MKNYTVASSRKDKDSVPIQVTYSYEIDQLAGNLIKSNEQFVKFISENKSLVIEGDKDDLFIFNINNNSYKLRGVFLPTTMLVTDQFDESQTKYQNGQNLQNINDPPSKINKRVSHVHLQTGNYLKIQPYDIDFNILYADVKNLAVSYKQFLETQNITDLLQDFGLPLSQIRAKFKLTSSQFQLIVKRAPVATFLPQQIPLIQEPYYLILDLGLMLGILRSLIPFLTENAKIGEWFTLKQICSSIKIEHQKILMVIAKIFQLQINYPIQQSYSLVQKIDVEGDLLLRQYKLTLNSIIHFILLEMASEKQEYTVHEMNDILENMLKVYLPIGLEDFQQKKAQNKVPELMGQHFLTIDKGSITIRKYYDPLLIDSTIKGRIQFMSGFKRKFTFWEIKGMFSRLVGKENVDLSQILMKNFRKCGNNEYEIKLIIPK